MDFNNTIRTQIVMKLRCFVFLIFITFVSHQIVSSSSNSNETDNTEQTKISKYLEAANRAFDSKQYEEAAKLYEEILIIENDRPITHYNLALCYKQIEKYDKSIEHFEKYLLLDPNADDKEEIQKTIAEIRKIGVKIIEKNETTSSSVCKPHHSKKCNNNDIYWFDSCGNQEDIAENCQNRNRGCSSILAMCLPRKITCTETVKDPYSHTVSYKCAHISIGYRGTEKDPIIGSLTKFSEKCYFAKNVLNPEKAPIEINEDCSEAVDVIYISPKSSFQDKSSPYPIFKSVVRYENSIPYGRYRLELWSIWKNTTLFVEDAIFRVEPGERIILNCGVIKSTSLPRSDGGTQHTYISGSCAGWNGGVVEYRNLPKSK